MEIKLKENSNLIVKNHSGDVLCSIDEATGNADGFLKLYLHKLNVTCTDSNSNTVYFNFSVFTNNPNLVTGYLQQNYLIFDFATNVIAFMGAPGSEFVTAVDSSSDPKFYALKMTLWGTGKYGFNPAGIIPLSNNATSPSLAVLTTFYISDIVQKF